MGLLSRVIRALHSFLHISPRRRRRRRHYPKDLRVAMQRINNIRKRHGVKPIPIDDRALNLGKARLRDLHRYHYFAHVNPKTKSNPATLKGKFGFSHREYAAENLFGGGRSADMYQAIDAWMKSDGHRRNLLYPDHTGGAIVAYRGNVAFIGVNMTGLGAVY